MAEAAADRISRPSEEPLRRIASRAPEFAGYYYTEHNDLVIRTTGGSDAVLLSAFEDVKGPIPSEWYDRDVDQHRPITVLVEHATYSFDQLRAWRDAVWKQILDAPGAIYVYISPRHNALVVGIAEGAAIGTLLEIAAEGGLPGDALELMEDEYPEPLSSLSSKHRPLLGGGLQLARFSDDHHRCTIGFHAYSYDLESWGFVTNSHCTSQMFSTGGDIFHQHQRPVGGGNANRIGQEAWDPPGWPCGSLWLKTCRNSDAAFIAYDTLSASDYFWGFAAIARTLNYNGSTTIDSSKPQFHVVSSGSSTPDPVLDKVGRSTGWTYGSRVASCVDVNGDGNERLLCQSKVDWWISPLGGDSGSPVFYWHDVSNDGPDVQLVGILWSGSGYYSPIENIVSDLGDLNVTW